MNERKLQLRIGFMVLATGIIAATLVVMFGEGLEMFRSYYTVEIMVSEAEGVREKTPICKRGILVGRVTRVELVERGVRITAQIHAEHKIHDNEICRIYPSVLGDADVHFALPLGEDPSPQFVSPGETIQGVIARDPMQMIGDLEGDFTQVVQSVAATSQETTRIMRKVADLFERNEDQIDTIVARAGSNMSTIQETLDNANQLLGDPEIRDNLKQSVAQFPEVVQDARATLDRVQRTAEAADQMIVKADRMIGAANRNLENLETFTAVLGTQGTEAVVKLDQGTAKLHYVLDQMTTFSQTLNQSDGSLGMLVRDRELYNNIRDAAANIEQLSRDLRPVVNDARIFSDKIARHPEMLGVRGAITRNPGTKGSLPSLQYR